MSKKASLRKSSLAKSSFAKSKNSVYCWLDKVGAVDLAADNYTFEIIQIIENSPLAIPKVNEIIHKGKVSEEIKSITKADIVKCLETGIIFENSEMTGPSLSNDLLKNACSEINMEEFSTEHLAGLIKIIMLKYKEEYITNREMIEKLKKQMDDDLKKILSSKGNDKGKDKGKGKDAKGKGKGKGPGNLEDVYEELHKNIDPNSLMNVQKEINIYTTDFVIPEQPTTTYFILCQMYDTRLIHELSKLALDVNLFIEVGTEYRNDYLPEDDAYGLEEYICEFWDIWGNCFELSEILPPYTCYLKYIPQDALSETDNFENLKRILYNIDDFRRQYKNYFNNTRYLDVKETRMPIRLDCLKLYNALLNQVPNECVTVPYLFDCLLEEVCTRVDKVPSSLEPEKPKIIQKVHGGPVHQIKTLLNKYDFKLKTAPAQQAKIPKTIHLRYGNVLEYITGNIKFGDCIVNTTLGCLKRFAPLNLFDMFPIKDNTSNTMLYNYLFYKWSNEMENITDQELKQCVYSLLFSRKYFKPFTTICNKPQTKYNLNSLMFDQVKPYNENSLINEPNIFFDPYDSKLGILRKDPVIISESCFCQTKSTLTCDCHDVIEQYCSLGEQMDPTTLIQVLTVAHNHFKHFDYKYFSPNDVVLLRFHYNTDRNKLITVKCINTLRTVLCFRDFFTFVLSSDVDWFVQQENIYWENKKEEDRLQEEKKLIQMRSQITCDNNFIITGSIKDEAMSTNEKGKSKDKVKEKADKPKDGKGKGKKEENQVKPPPPRVSFPAVPTKFPPYDPSINYAFEVYNLGSDQLQSRDETIAFHSLDGMSVYVRKQKWSKQALYYSFNIASNNSNLIIHNILNNVLTSENPFNFHLNVANGIVMAFTKPVSKINTDTKHVITNSIKKREPVDTIFSKSEKEMSTINFRNETVEYIKKAIKENIPVFKIISSRLHKYQYVKRIKSRLEIPAGRLLKRVMCKPPLYLRLRRSRTLQESKCIPYTNFAGRLLSPMHMAWKASLPTGLLLQAVPAVEPYDFYIKQKYIIYRPDLKGIKDEAYRCFLRNGAVMKFLKDGTIITYTADKNICHYKYGCFSSNTRKKQTIEEEILSNLPEKKVNNIIPLHFYINDLSKLQKKVRKICKKYKKHLIDISDNYRFESSRMECRKLHKVYKLSKKLFIDKSYTIPLLNYTVISAEGRKIDVKNNIVYNHEKRYRQMEFNDYLLSETIIHREDGTSWLMNTNGTAVTQFADGTRITTWCTVLDESFTDKSISDQSSVKSFTPSTDKYCQVDDNSRTTNELESIYDILDGSGDFSVIYSADTKIEDEGFVLIGMNYMFEHPNYATVTYFSYDDITNIKLPDNVEVTIDKDGFYNISLLDSDYIEIQQNGVNFNGGSCSSCKTTCKLNVTPLITEDAEQDEQFLILKDSTNRVFQVKFNGEMSSFEDNNMNISAVFCNLHSTTPSERCFVLRRDLSGEEYFRESIPYNFLHTLNKKDANANESEHMFLLDETYCTTSIQPLRKTYTEHLMMLYEFPILATISEKRCIDKLWKLHDFDMNTVIFKRKPLYTFKRLINRLPISIIDTMSKMLEQCLSGVFYNAPELSIVEDIPEVEEVIPAPVFKKPSKIFPLKSKTVKELCEKYSKLIKSGEIPKYFHTLYGVMFTTVEECSEGALTESDGLIFSPFSDQKKEIEEETEMKDESIEKKAEYNTYPGKLNIPQELTIHLKPDSYVHDIELTSVGLRVITEKSVQEYNFPTTPDNLSVEKINIKKSQNSVNDKISIKTIPLNTEIIKSVTKKKSRIKKSVATKKTLSETQRTKYKDMDDLYIKDIQTNLNNACQNHQSLQDVCKKTKCICEIPPAKSITKRMLCNCTDIVCHCPKSENKGSDTSCYTPEIDFQKLALTTIHYFSSNTLKLKILYSDLHQIIPNATQYMELSVDDTFHYVEALRIHIQSYIEKQNYSKEYVLDILNNIKMSNTSISSKYSDKLGTFDLNAVASTINKAIINPNSGNTKESKVDYVRQKFVEMNISSMQQSKVINFLKNQYLTISSELHEESITIEKAPTLFQNIIHEVNAVIESTDKYKKCCNICNDKITENCQQNNCQIFQSSLMETESTNVKKNENTVKVASSISPILKLVKQSKQNQDTRSKKHNTAKVENKRVKKRVSTTQVRRRIEHVGKSESIHKVLDNIKRKLSQNFHVSSGKFRILAVDDMY